MELFQAMLGMDGSAGMGGDDDKEEDATIPNVTPSPTEPEDVTPKAAPPAAAPAPPPSTTKTESTPQPMEVEEVVESDDEDDVVELDPEEERKLEAQKKVLCERKGKLPL